MEKIIEKLSKYMNSTQIDLFTKLYEEKIKEYEHLEIYDGYKYNKYLYDVLNRLCELNVNACSLYTTLLVKSEITNYQEIEDLYGEDTSTMLKALKKIEDKAGLCLYNLGTGVGYSVLDIVKNFEEANDLTIPYVIKERRPGDIATCYADAKKAEEELGWKAQYGIREMCEDAWRWQKNNPNGFED